MGIGAGCACVLAAATLSDSPVAIAATTLPIAVPMGGLLAGAGGEIRLALASDGQVGAWLVAGPFERTKVFDEQHLSPRLGSPLGDARWQLASSNDGLVDMAAAIDTHANERVAYAGAVLHLRRAGRHVLLLGADDGVAVLLDGKRVFARDEWRAQRDDDDLVPLDLEAGDHSVILALHQRTGAWQLRARWLDAELQPPAGAWWGLPGTTEEDAKALAARAALVSFDRGMCADGYRPTLTVRFRGGAPRGVRLDVHARLARAAGGEALFDVDAGEVPVSDRAVSELLVALPRIAADEVEDDDWTMHVDVAGRSLDLPMHPRRGVREATGHAARALAEARATATGVPRQLPVVSLQSVENLHDRLVAQVAHGDGDLDAQLQDAHELEDAAAAVQSGRDPYAHRTGPMRRAYRSPADDKLSEFALYVPRDFNSARANAETWKYPLIVALHGMNGHPMQMMMWLFGHDDPARDGSWEDRHPRKDLEPLAAIVVAPGAHFNSMYRDMGEDDVMRVVEWVKSAYPIDEARVTVTGPSMGGIGSAACALHHPDQFAAAEPLCGYHSYFVRGDINARSMRPWERFGAEQRSNALWAENGMYLPLYVVHGTKDLPEENSGVLIDRYEELHYDVKHEHPELGHNVWQSTYEDLKGASWLLDRRRPTHPRALRFKTPSTRWADDAWLHVRELSSSDGWGEVSARIEPANTIRASTRGLDALSFDRDVRWIDDAMPVTVAIDSSRFVFQAGEPIDLHREGPSWISGPASRTGLFKHRTTTGPLHDIFHEPVLFVWGASDPLQSRANEETARSWAHIHPGVRVDYPAMSDTDFYELGEAVANDHALFLVGNARSNRVVRELEPSLPIRVEGEEVVFAMRDGSTTRIPPHADGTVSPADRSQLGVAFIQPNPRRIDRYVVIVEGVGPLGTWRSTSLPDILPDYVVYDEGVAPARGQLVLGAASVRAAGYFANDWSLPRR
ncbi:MAG: alpha/beta hydrolase-fold protein [Myxococcota bacterium]|nr:alpha/beta hydrolase-fold protein [Myxococcota bacterium]